MRIYREREPHSFEGREGNEGCVGGGGGGGGPEEAGVPTLGVGKSGMHFSCKLDTVSS